MNSTLPVLAGLIGTMTGVTATYVVARRRLSGRIGTSEAADLWAASESIRHDLSAEVSSLRAEVVSLRAEVATLRSQNIQLSTDLAHLGQRRNDA